MKTLMVFLALLLGTVLEVSAAKDVATKDTVNNWYFWKADGPGLDTTYTRLTSKSYAGKSAQVFGNSARDDRASYKWRKDLGKSYLFPKFLTAKLALDSMGTDSVNGAYIELFVGNRKDESVIYRMARTGFDGYFLSHPEWFPRPYWVTASANVDTIITRPDSIDFVVIRLCYYINRDPKAEFIIDNLTLAYGKGNPWWNGTIDSTIIIDRFGDPDPKPAKLSALSSVDFGKMPLNATLYKDTAIVFRNLGDSVLHGSLSVKGNDFYIGDTTLNVLPMDSVSRTLWFNPATIGKATGLLVVKSNNSTSPDTILLNAFVIGAVPSAEPSKVNMGNTPIGTVRQDTIYIKNDGNIVLLIDSVRSTNPKFTVTPVRDSIAAGNKGMFIVTFRPVTLGAENDTLLFFNDSPTSPVKVTLSGMVVTEVKELKVLPTEFSLSQNYPNPFNPSTTIEFSLPNRANVNLTVYNTLGQAVEILINGELNGGDHQYVWNAMKYTSGVYFYRLTTNNFVETKKMLLVK